MISSAAAPPVLWRDKQSYKAGKMIKGKYSIDTRRMRAKIRQWERQVEAEQLEAVREYGAEAARQMVKCTPPGNAKQAVGTSLKKLRERIQRDFEGDGAAEAYQDEDVRWYRDTSGRLRAYFRPESSSAKNKKGQASYGLVSPFRVVRGRVSKRALAALGVGHRVEFVKNVGAHIAENRANYRVYARYKGAAARMHWHGVRHVATVASVRREIKARQRKAGQLMAGWKALAARSGAKLPAAVQKQRGKGTATVKRDWRGGAVIEGHNKGFYPGLQRIVDRQMPALRKKVRSMAKKRARKFAAKLKK